MASTTAHSGRLFYDPDCGFCTRSVTLIKSWQPRAVIEPLSPAASTWGVDPERALAEIPFVHADGRVVYGPAALAAALRGCRVPYRWLGTVLGFAPIEWTARPIYRWVARHRHQLPGGSAACDLSGRK